MVAKGDGSWRLAKSLITLIDQVDAKFPIRDRSSDGSIGDARHQAEVSDHNPDREGVVRALDITHDPAHGVDTYMFAENLRLGRDPRIKYVISNRKICGDEGFAKRSGVPAWTWTAYHGTNPHNMHVHISVNANDVLADDTRPWVFGDIGSPERPRLKEGDSGDAVKEAQQHLGIAVTGAFDGATDEAVRAFQARGALTVDGVIGPYTWRALLADRVPDPTGQSTELSADTISAIASLASSSPIARYHWRERGTAPVGYIKGMAVTFALVCQKWKAGDSAVHLMAAADTGSDNVDALSWYNSNFHALGMSNDVAGLNTLRHLFVLLLGLGMRESSGNCFAGRDITAANPSSETAEAGLFQQSHDSFGASPEFANLMAAYEANPSWGFQHIFREGVAGGPSPNVGDGVGAAFQRLCKISPAFAVEAAAIGLRRIGGNGDGRGHWGPINRKEAEPRPEADALLTQVQQIVEGAPAPVPFPAPRPQPIPVPPMPKPQPIPAPAPQPQPAPAPPPQPPAPMPAPPPIAFDRLEAALTQLIALFKELLNSIRQPVSVTAALGSAADTTTQPSAQPPQTDVPTLIQQLMAFAQAAKGQLSTPPAGPLTPAQLQDQLSQLRDLLNALSAGGTKAGLPKLGQVNGALGQTIGNLLDGKKTAVGILGALVTAILQSTGQPVPLDKIIPIINSQAGLSSIAMPIFLALSSWGVLGKLEKWTGASPMPPKKE